MNDNRNNFNANPTDGWEALRYAARRLDAADTARFEDRLADDVSACEAVAQAVELAHTVAFMHLETSPLEATPPKEQFLAKVASAAIAETGSDATDNAPVTVVRPANSKRTNTYVVACLGWMVAAAVLGFVYLGSRSVGIDEVGQPGQGTVAEQMNTDDQVTSAWANLSGRRLSNDEAPLPNEEVVVEQTGLREIPRDADEALMLDWLMSGLREEQANPISTPN